MKKYLTIIAFSFLLTSCNSPHPEKAEDIIAEYLKVSGGKNKILTVRNYHAKGTFTIGKSTCTYETFAQFHNKLKIVSNCEDFTDTTLYLQKKIFAKTNGKIVQSSSPRQLQDYEINAYIFPLAYLHMLAKRWEYNESTEIDGVELDELEIEFKNELVWNVYFDKKTHFINRIQGPDNFEMKYLKLEKFQGIVFPTLIKISLENRLAEMDLKELEYNVKIENKIFSLH